MKGKFRDRDIRTADPEGWCLLSTGEEGLQVWAKESPEGVVFKRTGPQEFILYQFAALNQQAQKLGKERPNLLRGTLTVPDWGHSFLFRRQQLGWQQWMEDTLAYERALVSLYPQVCFDDVALRNCVIDPKTGEASQPDVRTVMTEAEAIVRFDTLTEYILFVRKEIEDSWCEFLEEYEDEIDLVQEGLEDADKAPFTHTPCGSSIRWKD
jgi:hypothetical protein